MRSDQRRKGTWCLQAVYPFPSSRHEFTASRVLHFPVKYVIATFPGSPGNVMPVLSVITCLDDQNNLIDLCNDTSRMKAHCCASCRVLVLRALACLRADLIPYVYGLEQVSRDLYDPSAEPCIYPTHLHHRPRRRR